MIHVDISNIWGQLSLQDLLGIEREVFTAHAALPEQETWKDTDRIRKASEAIRAQSQVCVVLGMEPSCLAARAAAELLQADSSCRVVFAGSSLSTRQWNRLQKQLEGKHFSVIVISATGTDPACALALRNLKWMLERRYGTDESSHRIYAVTASGDSVLGRMAEDHGWACFTMEEGSVLSAAGLLPMAAAGIDVEAMLRAAVAAREEYDLRSFENPVWLYTAVRTLMSRSGKHAELLTFWEPDFAPFAVWWQRLAGESGCAPFTVGMELPGGLSTLERMVQTGGGDFFETALRFENADPSPAVVPDVTNPDGLDFLSGQPLDRVEETAYFDTMEAHADGGIPVITMECGSLDASSLGALFVFLELSCGISRRIREAAGKNSAENSQIVVANFPEC